MLKMTRQECEDLAKRTENAYSYDRYKSWKACAIVLMDDGYDIREAEAILRSKHMRWAADCSNSPYGKVTSTALKHYLAAHQAMVTGRQLQELVDGTVFS